MQVLYNNKGYHSMPTYLNVLNNAILRANLPAAKGNPAAYGNKGPAWREAGSALPVTCARVALLCHVVFVFYRFHADKSPNEQNQRQPLFGLPVSSSVTQTFPPSVPEGPFTMIYRSQMKSLAGRH